MLRNDYTPKTNVIEMVFNQIKHYLKLNKKVLKYPELKREVGKAISKIKPMNYKNYFLRNSFTPYSSHVLLHTVFNDHVWEHLELSIQLRFYKREHLMCNVYKERKWRERETRARSKHRAKTPTHFIILQS